MHAKNSNPRSTVVILEDKIMMGYTTQKVNQEYLFKKNNKVNLFFDNTIKWAHVEYFV